MTERRQDRSERPESAYFERLVQTTEQATRSVVPMIGSAARANLELVSLAGRRARAYLDVPNTIAQCRGPQDLFAAQARFWQTAFRDYTDCAQRVLTSFSAVDREAAAGENGAAKRERDTLTFPDVFSLTTWSLPEPPPRRREAEGRAA